MQHKITLLLLAFFITIQLSAQTNGNSPYSRYGIGDLVDDNFMHTRSMGGIGTASIDGYHINIVNPASYASLRSTAFDLGLAAKKSTLSSGDLTSSSWSGNLEYISLAFPIFNPINEILDQEKRKINLGMAFTLMPNSSVSYNIVSEDNIDGIGDISRAYTGNGGSYKFLWGNAIKYKDFSFGINLGYLFGKIKYSRNVNFLDIPAAYHNRFFSEYNMKGLLFDFGAIYSNVLNKKQLLDKTAVNSKLVTVGVRIKSATKFNTNLTSLEIALQNAGFGNVLADTLSSVINEEGTGKLPVEIGFGVNYYSGEKYMIGLDFSTTNWSSYHNDADKNTTNNQLSNTFAVSIGGFYRPNYKSYNHYFKRVYYRYGMNYNTDPRNIEGTQLNNFCVTVGMGLPFIYQRKISHANIGFELGKRGTGTPITETYYKISLGFTFNDDDWFVKRKYN